MDNRICTRCLLRDMEGAEAEIIEKYKEKIKTADRVDDETYERRLDICKSCEKLNAGTCNSCGCYVELRAIASISHCPNKKW